MIKLYPLKLLINRLPDKKYIEMDIRRWVRMNDNSRSGGTIWEQLMWLLYAENMEEFRNLLYFRFDSPSSLLDKFLLSLSKTLFQPLETLSISASTIGPGLVIKHGYGTAIKAQTIGENCLIFQDVVIGYKNETDDLPIIGNCVHVSVGSKVLGNITIGDYSVIAANSVVTKDMPPNSLAIGIPARIIRDAGTKAEHVANGEVSV
ncbi:MAG: serine acetyltransferase [Anaerolineales bacterium]|nr:serine acetyltransferase [Anaerolineales bacterium]